MIQTMSIIILTGPVASGKNTISKILAEKKERSAVIDVDVVRWMYIHPHKAPWDGEEGKSQQVLGVENACLLAKSFAQNNIDVIILDVITDETANLYKNNLAEVKIVLLMPSYKKTYERFVQRPPTVSEKEFKMIYKSQGNLTIYDEKIDIFDPTQNQVIFTMQVNWNQRHTYRNIYQLGKKSYVCITNEMLYIADVERRKVITHKRWI